MISYTMYLFIVVLYYCYCDRIICQEISYELQRFHILSHDVASESDITLCIKYDKPLVVCIFVNVMQ